MSKYRKPLKKNKSKKLFTKTAMRVNNKNVVPLLNRGGTRL